MRKVSSHRQKSLMRSAERLLQDESLLELPVDLEALAQTRGIFIREMESDEEGVSGMLLRHGDTFGILYSTQIPNIGFQRFSIAHELGHYFIDGHLDQIPFDGNMHRSRAGFASNNYYEREADHFAAGLLMPTTPVRRIIDRSPSGFGSIEAIQQKTNASLTAAAIRYVGMTDEAVAIIVSSDGIVDYCFMSETMKSLERIDWLHKNTLVPSDTITESILEKSEEEQREAYTEGEVDIMAWFGGRRSVAAGEEVIGLGSYGRILTVLTCPDPIDDDYMDEISDEALEESWTPRFRR